MSCSLEELSPREKADLVKQISDKKNGRTDQDWSEIREFFDLDINAETLRKAGVGIKLAADAGLLCDNNPSQGAGYIERQKLRDLSRQVNMAYRTESRSELLRETIETAVKELPAFKIHFGDNKIHSDGTEKSLVVAFGDFHYGADILVQGLYGETINEFNHDIFEKRMNKLLDDVVSICKKENIDKVDLMIVGDLIDGMLRQSQLMRLEYGIVESTMKLSEFLATWIDALSMFVEVDVFAATGNHSEIRPLRSKNREFEEENLEKIIMWYLDARLRSNESVFVDNSCRRYTLVEVEGFHFLLLHGDGEKNIDQIAKEAVNMYNEPIDFFICGHKHKEQEYPMGMTDSGNSVIVRVPSICGIDRYAQSKGYGGKPGAIAMVIEKGYGRRCVYPIQL